MRRAPIRENDSETMRVKDVLTLTTYPDHIFYFRMFANGLKIYYTPDLLPVGEKGCLQSFQKKLG
jgi:hypothetical protein